VKWVKYLPWLFVAVVAAGFLVPLVMIQVHVYLNERDKQPLLEALRREYPDLRFEGGGAFYDHRIYLDVFGKTDPAKQAAMRDWLAGVKAERGITQEVWLRFIDKERHADEEPEPTLKL
jgi:hypothetical protein